MLPRSPWPYGLVLAAFLDAATMLLLPVGAELNPLAAHSPALAIVAKAAVCIFILTAPLGRYARPVQLIGVLAWTAGAASNLLVIWR